MKYPTKYEIPSNIMFRVRWFAISYKKVQFQVGASIEPNEWEHVSVSLLHRNPSWNEMCFIKDLFFEPEEMCLQSHPKKSEYVNMHAHCLHIWKPSIDIIKQLEKV